MISVILLWKKLFKIRSRHSSASIWFQCQPRSATRFTSCSSRRNPEQIKFRQDCRKSESFPRKYHMFSDLSLINQSMINFPVSARRRQSCGVHLRSDERRYRGPLGTKSRLSVTTVSVSDGSEDRSSCLTSAARSDVIGQMRSSFQQRSPSASITTRHH